MLKLLALGGLALGLVTGGASAADLSRPTTAMAPAAAADPVINNFYVEGYGGLRLGNNLHWDGIPYDLAQGASFGGTVGYNVMQGLSFDIDAMRTNSYYSCCGTSDVLDSTSLMADVNYTYDLTDMFSVFAGVGVGAIWLNYDNFDNGVGAGYQAKVGVAAKVTDQLSVFAEYKYQSAFGDINTTDNTIEYHTGSVLGGLKVSF